MRKQFKQILWLLISVLFFTVYINSLSKLSKKQSRASLGGDVEDETLLRNELCEPVNLTFSDSIASHYMKGKHGRVECDALNGTNFVEISDVKIFDENDKTIDFNLIRILKRQGVFNEDDGSAESEAKINGYIHSIKLNMEVIVKRTGVKESSIVCSLEKYEKIFNVSERFNIRTEEVRIFNKKEGYTIYVVKHGYYNVNCTNAKKANASIYDDSYYVLPRDMSKLMKERALYKTKEPKLSEQSYEYDVEEKLDFLETLNQLRIEKKMNVLMFGFDSVSFPHLRRIFPKLYNFLTHKLENNVMFTSYNKVGVNTHPNMVPLLTGIVVNSIPSINASSEFSQYKKMDLGFYDKYPFIWHRYEKAGYLTGLQQDAPSIAVFNYLKRGFRLKPTAFYARPIWIKRKNAKKIDGRKACNHGRPLYKVAFTMLESFLDRMNRFEENSNIPYFIFNFLSEYTHDDFVVPAYIDQELTEMFIRFEDKGYFDNTLFVVFSDHGVRLVRYSYRTQTGKIETNLPFISIRLPKVMWNTVYHENLKNNKNKLITHYDTYQTLRHFFHLNQNYSNELDRRQFAVNDKNVRYLRGISLFEKVPVNRSCSDAMIPDNYCGCLKQYAMTDDVFEKGTGMKFNEAAEYIIDYINGLTEDVRGKCIAYSLERVEHVSGFDVNKMNRFQFVVVLDPGEAWFEVNIEINKNARKKEKIVTVLGNVIRLSPYGETANCVHDHILRNYCFCKSNR